MPPPEPRSIDSPDSGGRTPYGEFLSSALDCRHEVNQFVLWGENAGLGNAIFPQMSLLSRMKFDLPYVLVGLQFSTVFVNYGPSLMGAAVVIGSGYPNTAVSDKVNAPVFHETYQNSLVVPIVVPMPTSKTSTIVYGEYGIRIPVGTWVCLYGYWDLTANNTLHAIATLHLVQIR